MCLVVPPPVSAGLDVRGVVVDEQGAPVAGAYIVALEGYEPDRSPLRARPHLLRPCPDRPDLELVPRQGAESDADGAFHLQVSPGKDAAGEWRLDVSHRDFLPARERAIEPSPMRVYLRRPGSIAGMVAVDPAIECYRVSLAVDLGADRRVVSYDGSFEIDNVEPGTHSLAVYLGFDREPVLVVEDLEVRAGERTQPAALMPIDLRGLARTLTLEPVNETGHPIHGFYVVPLDAPEVAPWFGSDVSLTIPTAADTLDVAVAGFPTRVTRVHGAIGVRRVMLLPPLHIELALASGEPLPEAPLVLKPFVRRADEADPYPELTRMLDPYAVQDPLTDHRRATAQLTDVGTWQVGFVLLRTAEDPARPDLLVSRLVTVSVSESTTPVVIPVRLDPEMYQEVMRRVRGA